MDPPRLATEKQIALIRLFGVNPREGVTLQEASELIDNLFSDPRAMERYEENRTQMFLANADAEEDRIRKTPAPKGIKTKGLKAAEECRKAIAWLLALEHRWEQYLATTDGIANETLTDFDNRISGLRQTLNELLGGLESLLEQWEQAPDRPEKRVVLHELDEFLTENTLELETSLADVGVLIDWLEQLEKSTRLE